MAERKGSGKWRYLGVIDQSSEIDDKRRKEDEGEQEASDIHRQGEYPDFCVLPRGLWQ